MTDNRAALAKALARARLITTLSRLVDAPDDAALRSEAAMLYRVLYGEDGPRHRFTERSDGGRCHLVRGCAATGELMTGINVVPAPPASGHGLCSSRGVWGLRSLHLSGVYRRGARIFRLILESIGDGP